MTSFKLVRARAEERKGGVEKLKALLPPAPPRDALNTISDDRVLAETARRGFSAGFSWNVIKAKWSGFEEAFLGFEPDRLAFEPDNFWHERRPSARCGPSQKQGSASWAARCFLRPRGFLRHCLRFGRPRGRKPPTFRRGGRSRRVMPKDPHQTRRAW